jgi:CBS domain-containing protein
VSPEDTAEKARSVMREFGFDWTSVIEDGELLGWVDEGMLRDSTRVGDVTPRRFSAYVTGGDSLRQALDSIATSRTNVAVVVTEAQRYRGILTVERISEEIIS